VIGKPNAKEGPENCEANVRLVKLILNPHSELL
jgi:hypothetical protein